MDPITAFVFATTVAFGVPATRPPGAAKLSQARTEYVLDRRNARSDDSQITGFNDPVFAELLSYKSFSDGWDGEGSLAPSHRDIDVAIAFTAMARDYLPLPTAMISPEGQIGLYWDTPLAYIDINFDVNGTLSIYSRRRDISKDNESYMANQDPSDVQTLLPIMEVLNPMQMAA